MDIDVEVGVPALGTEFCGDDSGDGHQLVAECSEESLD